MTTKLLKTSHRTEQKTQSVQLPERGWVKGHSPEDHALSKFLAAFLECLLSLAVKDDL